MLLGGKLGNDQSEFLPMPPIKQVLRELKNATMLNAVMNSGITLL